MTDYINQHEQPAAWQVKLSIKYKGIGASISIEEIDLSSQEMTNRLVEEINKIMKVVTNNEETN